jgi:GH18 family chitinase
LAVREAYGSDKFITMAKDEETRKQFIQNCVQNLTNHGFDGLELYWQDPKENEMLAFHQLIKARN